MLSLSCKAAIKTVIYLGLKHETGEKCGIKEIAIHIKENEHTVGKIAQKLVKHRIIVSAKGPHGGFYITPQQKKQAIINIVEAIDGLDVFTQCGLGLSKCSDTRPCPVHNDFKPVRERFRKMCEEKKIIDLYQNVHDGLAFLKG